MVGDVAGAISRIGLTRPSTTHGAIYTAFLTGPLWPLPQFHRRLLARPAGRDWHQTVFFLICIISTNARDKLLMAHQERPILYCLDSGFCLELRGFYEQA